jgi:CHAT domain-containing protein/tetratricopeptide (TPR) repeat protein
MRLLRSAVLGLIFSCGPFAVSAQSRDCSIERNPHLTALVPVMEGQFADPKLAANIRHAYELNFQLHQFKEAEAVFHQTLKSSLQKKNPCAEGLSSYALGAIALNDHLSEAKAWFHEAEAALTAANSSLGIARVHYQIAYLGALNGQVKEAASQFGTAAAELEELGDPVSAVLARLQQLEKGSDNPPSSAFEPLLAQAAAIPSTYAQAVTLHAWGDDDNRRSQYANAMEHYEAADKLFSACNCAFSDRSYLQTSMGRVERLQGRPEAALPHYHLAMRLQMQSHELTYLPQTINAIGVAYGSMHNYPRATEYYRQALAVAHQIHSQPFIDFLEANLGYAYYQMGRPGLAIPLLEHAVSLQTTANGICIRASQLGEAYLAVDRFHDAEEKETQAIAACEKAAKKDDLASEYAVRAKARLKIGNLAELDGALADIRQSKSLLEEVRSGLAPEDAYKQGYAQRNMDIFDTSIAILTRIDRKEEALETAEQARARAFLDLLSSPHSSSGSKPAAPHGLLTVALNNGPISTRDSLLKSEGHVEPIQPGEILATLNRLHSTLLSYWIANDTLYTWVLRPDQPIVEVTQTINPTELEALVRKTRPSPGASRLTLSPEDRLAWHRLYDLFILPIADHLPTEPGSLLTIIPNGPLFQVAFPALIDRKGHYLIEQYAIHTSPAVGLLHYTAENDRAASEHTPLYVFIANPAHFPVLANGLRLPPLPGTEAEVKTVSASLPPAEVILLDRNNAGISQLVATLPEATVLHFATHAVVNDADPFASFLALDRDQDGGELSTADIYNLKLHTRLVVLSACRTGLGKISGDGVAGLSRAFFYSGAASVLATLWDVADQPTAILLPRFYRQMTSGRSRSAALRDAQLSLIADLRHGKVFVNTPQGKIKLPENPLFWAAFSLSGEP